MTDPSPWIQTVSGKQFPLLNPVADAIDIADIAHGLSMLCRFNGQCLRFYSVAEHSVLVSKIVPPEYALWGLMHDSAEAYLGDMPSPLKKHVTAFKDIERRLLDVITDKFSLALDEPPAVKGADRALLRIERDVLMSPSPVAWPGDEEPLALQAPEVAVECWDPATAKRRFLSRFNELRA